MIVCVCNRIDDKVIRDACRDCPRNSGAESVLSSLGCKSVCGKCLCFMDEMIAQVQTTSFSTAEKVS